MPGETPVPGRVAELRETLLQLVGQQRRADQVVGLLLVVDAVGFLEGFAPVLLAVIAAPEPSERQQLDTLQVAQ
jgi:hypothetical protein